MPSVLNAREHRRTFGDGDTWTVIGTLRKHGSPERFAFVAQVQAPSIAAAQMEAARGVKRSLPVPVAVRVEFVFSGLHKPSCAQGRAFTEATSCEAVAGARTLMWLTETQTVEVAG